MAKKYSGKPWILQSSHSGVWGKIQKDLVTIFLSWRLSCSRRVSCNCRRDWSNRRKLHSFHGHSVLGHRGHFYFHSRNEMVEVGGNCRFFFPCFDRNPRACCFSIYGREVGSKVNQRPSNRVQLRVGDTWIWNLNWMISHLNRRGEVLLIKEVKVCKSERQSFGNGMFETTKT